MIIANEKASKELSKAKTIKERNSILMRLYLENMGDKAGDALFHHHLTELETVTSHLDDISYASPKVITIKNIQLLALIGIGVEMIDEIIGSYEAPKYVIIAHVWPMFKRLYSSIYNYDGNPHPLYKRMRLIHRTAKILLEAWSRYVQLSTVSSIYYSDTEEEFAKHLAVPILTSMPLGDQIDALQKNIDDLMQTQS